MNNSKTECPRIMNLIEPRNANFPWIMEANVFFFFGCFFFLNCNNGLHESLILERCVATKTIFKETTLSTIQ